MSESMIEAGGDAGSDVSSETAEIKQEELNLGGEAQKEEVTEEKAEAEREDGYLYAGKYKSIDELEKGYKEAVTKLTEKNPGAPEEYNFDFSENETLKSLDIDLSDDPMFNAALPAFKDAGLTQEQAQSIVASVLEKTVEDAPDIGEELKKLGDNGAQIVDEVQRFVDKSLSAEEQEIAVLLGQSAAGINFMHKYAKAMSEKPIPADIGDHKLVISSDEAINEAMAFKANIPNFDNDSKAKARYEKMMDDAIRIKLKEGKQIRVT